MKTIVTGGTGFIGSHLVKRLLDQGRDVTIVSNQPRLNANLSTLKVCSNDIEFRQADLRDFGQTLKAVQGAESIFHFAGSVGSLESHSGGSSEFFTLQSNLTIDANVIRASLERGVKKLIYASSCSVYPVDNKPDVVYSEKDRLVVEHVSTGRRFKSLNPDGGYGWAKLIGEVELGLAKDINVSVARMFNIYGVNEPLEKGARLVGRLLKTILQPNAEIVLTGDGNQTRDFLYVTDCVAALIQLEKKAETPPVTVNIGSGRPTSIGTVARKLVEISGKKVQIKFDISKAGGLLSRTADISKAKALLDWQPEVILDDGLRLTYEWAKVM